jgi:protein-tyrosine-phosphatase
VAHRAGVVATSAGLDALPGAPASAPARTVASQAGLTLDAHLSRPITEPVVAAAGIIYTMTAAQADALRRAWPQFSARIHRLDPYGDIADPFGGDDATYRATLRHIERAVATRLGLDP